MKHLKSLTGLFLFCLLGLNITTSAQMITGTWKGKVNKLKAEIKIIQNGDSLTGTSYYYESATHYRRYSIKGYFDAESNEAVWWDDQLLEEKPAQQRNGKVPFLARADFNCPGDGTMMLDGKAGRKSDETPNGDLHLDKTGSTAFPDEWDYVIDNYTAGASDPYIIDSIETIALQFPSLPVTEVVQEVISPPVRSIPQKQLEKPMSSPVAKPVEVSRQPIPGKILPPVTIEQKFVARKKILVTEIPVTGDSVELRFYDNAEIDGDSISLFLNEKLIFQHIRLLGSAYTIKLAVNSLLDTNELIMVAENLGSIPPNTSFMVAEVGNKRYEARLESTEGSSAMIRFIKVHQ